MTDLVEKVATEITARLHGSNTGLQPTYYRPAAKAAIAIVLEEAAVKWQPIETAPKDGTPILAYMPDADGEPYQIYVVRMMGKIGDEWWQEAGGEQWATYKPTHWMPRPELPEDAEK